MAPKKLYPNSLLEKWSLEKWDTTLSLQNQCQCRNEVLPVLRVNGYFGAE